MTTTVAADIQPAHDHRVIGAAGVVMVLGIIVLGPVMGGPDALGSNAVTHYDTMLAGSHFLSAAPARFGCYALLTGVELVFFAGLWTFVRRIAPRTIAAPLVALCGAAFVAGGMAADAFSFGQMISLHAGNGVQADGNFAVIADASSNLLLIEVNICLAVAVAAVSTVGLRTRVLPAPLCWFGLFAAAASVVPGFTPTTEAVFIGSNLLRLAFIVGLSALFLRNRLTLGPSTPTA